MILEDMDAGLQTSLEGRDEDCLEVDLIGMLLH